VDAYRTPRLDNSTDIALTEAAQTASEIKSLSSIELPQATSKSAVEPNPTLTPTQPHKEIALIFDYMSDWSLRVQPQGNNYGPLDWVMSIYTACRACGTNIDILPPSANLEGYRAIVVANQQLEHSGLLASLKLTKAQIILGPRSFSKTQQYQIPKNLAPGSLQDLIPLKAVRVESLNSAWSTEVNSADAKLNETGESLNAPLSIKKWREFIETDLKPKFTSNDGWGFLYQHNNIHYINGCMDQCSLNQLFMQLLSENESLQLSPCPNGLRQQKLGQWQFFFNYGPEEQSNGNC